MMRTMMISVVIIVSGLWWSKYSCCRIWGQGRGEGKRKEKGEKKDERKKKRRKKGAETFFLNWRRSSRAVAVWFASLHLAEGDVIRSWQLIIWAKEIWHKCNWKRTDCKLAHWYSALALCLLVALPVQSKQTFFTKVLSNFLQKKWSIHFLWQHCCFMQAVAC